MTTNGPCRSFSFFDSAASRMYCSRLKPKGSSPLVRYCARLLVEALGVVAMDLGDVHRQRAVHEDRDIRNPLLVGELVQQQHQLLRTPDGEGRDDDPPAAPRGPVDHVGQLVDRRGSTCLCSRPPYVLSRIR